MARITEPMWNRWTGGWIYYGPCYHGGEFTGTTHRLGEIKKRKDSRYDYWLYANNTECPVPGWAITRATQGVVNTLELAKARVEAGFVVAPSEVP